MTQEEFKKRVYNWAEKIGVTDKIKSIQLRNLKNKIASCSNTGRLTFDISILNMDTNRIDEIIVHELLHFRYPNHGKLFKYILKEYLSKDDFKL